MQRRGKRRLSEKGLTEPSLGQIMSRSTGAKRERKRVGPRKCLRKCKLLHG